jgi:heme exporter protein A
LTTKLSGKDLTLIRGETCLFQGLGFALNPGELLLLEGQNGSGKTSLIRAIAGMLSLESGEIFWNGKDVSRQRQEFHGELVWLAHRTGLTRLQSTIDLEFPGSRHCHCGLYQQGSNGGLHSPVCYWRTCRSG